MRSDCPTSLHVMMNRDFRNGTIVSSMHETGFDEPVAYADAKEQSDAAAAAAKRKAADEGAKAAAIKPTL